MILGLYAMHNASIDSHINIFLKTALLRAY
jgi:hypothetical protein